MRTDTVSIPCCILRGGTSKGVFFLENSLPAPGPERDRVLLRVFGSPDMRQIDGLGGANSLTSKVAIIGVSAREDADVDYTFGQVSFAAPVIDWKGNCGNISSAVGLYAVAMNLVKPVEPYTCVRIYNTNTDKMIRAMVPVKHGSPVEEGDYAIDGVPGTGAKITLNFVSPAGSVTGKLLPTGKAAETVDLGEKGCFTVSMVDAGNPVVFLKAEELGLKGTELPLEVEGMPETLRVIEEIRSVMAERSGIVKDRGEATAKSPAIPKIGFVSTSQDYLNPDGKLIRAEQTDLTARLCSMQKMHRAYMVTGGVATGAAAKIEGSVVWQAVRPEAREKSILNIGHPYGVMDVEVKTGHGQTEGYDGDYIESVGVGRTARMILEGRAYVPRDLLAE